MSSKEDIDLRILFAVLKLDLEVEERWKKKDTEVQKKIEQMVRSYE